MLYNLTNGDDNYIDFNSSNDTINGLAGNDQITGGSGNDVIDGGPGNDILAGGAGSDLLIGGTGLDIFRDTAAGLNGDHIQDLLVGDRIQITDLNFATAVIGISGSSLTYNDGTHSGSVTVDNLGPGRLFVSGLASGGVDIHLAATAHNDFNGDGRSDILWRNDDGTITDWMGTASGGFSSNWPNFNTNADSTWQIAGTGDFNGDGRVDLIWRNSDGTVTNWLGQANGSFSSNWANFNTTADSTWQIAGIGDFNGDGRSDILWRNSDGTMTNWLGQANGSFSSNWTNFNTTADSSWQIAGVGDFNGDGLADLIWRNSDGTVTNWLGQPNGGFSSNWANFNTTADSSWQIVGVGDFNGDGRADLIWRNSDGTVTDWLGQADGSFSSNWANFNTTADSSWQIASVGDFNGDGRDDIIWRNSDGTVTEWLGQANGGFAGNWANFNTHADSTWHVQDHLLF